MFEIGYGLGAVCEILAIVVMESLVALCVFVVAVVVLSCHGHWTRRSTESGTLGEDHRDVITRDSASTHYTESRRVHNLDHNNHPSTVQTLDLECKSLFILLYVFTLTTFIVPMSDVHCHPTELQNEKDDAVTMYYVLIPNHGGAPKGYLTTNR